MLHATGWQAGSYGCGKTTIGKVLLKLYEPTSGKVLFDGNDVTHHLAVVRFLSSRVGVMYCGKLVELANSRILYLAPKDPYTQALLASVLAPNPDLPSQEIVLEGDVISPITPP
jgi:ABC-type oligopeptide transport system ATPase subunit